MMVTAAAAAAAVQFIYNLVSNPISLMAGASQQQQQQRILANITYEYLSWMDTHQL